MKLNANASKKRGAKKAPPVAAKGKGPEITIAVTGPGAKATHKNMDAAAIKELDAYGKKPPIEDSAADKASDVGVAEDSAQDIDTAAPAPAPKAPKKLSAGQSAAIAMLASRRK